MCLIYSKREDFNSWKMSHWMEIKGWKNHLTVIKSILGIAISKKFKRHSKSSSWSSNASKKLMSNIIETTLCHKPRLFHAFNLESVILNWMKWQLSATQKTTSVLYTTFHLLLQFFSELDGKVLSPREVASTAMVKKKSGDVDITKV